MTLFDRTTAIKTHGVIRVSRPWENDIREGRVVLTPEMAQKILKESNYGGQRKVDRRSVNVYAEMMRRGLWELADPISFARLHGNLTLVNGQHRLHAIVAYGREVEFRIAINECETPEQVRDLYYRFDAVMRIRTPDQVINAIGLAEAEKVSRSIARATYGAVGIIANGFHTPGNGTLRDEAVPFWRGVAENDGLKRTDVRHLFVRDLLGRDVSINAQDQGIMTAAIAWNAWYEGRALKIIKVPENYNLRIAGTPIGGRR